MPDDIYLDDEDFEVHDDVEEYVDFDEHERARAYERRKKGRELRQRIRQNDFLDTYHYGEEPGEAYEA